MDKWAEVNKIFCGHLLETLSNYGDFSIAYRIKNLEKDYAQNWKFFGMNDLLNFSFSIGGNHK